MIQLPLSWLIFWVLLALLGSVLGAWLVSEWRRKWHERIAFRDVIRCSFCGCEFQDRTEQPLPRCPRCDTRNERQRMSRL